MVMLNILVRWAMATSQFIHSVRRSRDCVDGCTEFLDSLADMALAHAVESKVEGAYRGGAYWSAAVQ